MNVCVFCASSSRVDAAFQDAATALGRWIGARGHTLVWGGCNVGSMDAVGRATHEAGGRTVAIIPRFLVERGLAFGPADEQVVTDDMQMRKAEFRRRADAFVALPGGIGTWEEVLEVLALAKLGQLDAPILLANLSGYYDPLLLQLRHSVEAGFTPPEVPQLLGVATSIANLCVRLESASRRS